jgi:hypothetical protein
MAAKTRDKKWEVKIQHCPISSRLYMWVDNDVPNYFPTLKNFYRRHFQNGRHKTAQIAAILKMADTLKILKMQNCSSNGDLSLCQIVCLYHYQFRSYQH